MNSGRFFAATGLLSGLLAVFALAGGDVPVAAQQTENEEDRVVYTLEFTPEKLDELVENGQSVSSDVPEHLRKKISEVRLRPVQFVNLSSQSRIPLKLPAKFSNTAPVINDGIVVIAINDDVRGYLNEGFEVRYRITDRNFSSIRIERGNLTPASANASVESEEDRNKLYATTKSGEQFVGKISSPENLTLETTHGKLEIPWDQLIGLKSLEERSPASELEENSSEKTSEGASQVVVALKNGDIVTGRILIESLEFETTWGVAKLKFTEATQVAMLPNIRFQQQTASTGKQWIVGEELHRSRMTTSGRFRK